MQKNYKAFIEIIVALAIISFLIIHFCLRKYGEGENQWGWESIWGDIGYASIVVVFFAEIFNLFLWRISCLGRWLHTPNLIGEWKGEGHTSYNDTDFTLTLNIKQTFLRTHIHACFEKSHSHSFSSVFIHDDVRDKTILVYSYQNDPKIKYRINAVKGEEGGLDIHYGTTMLDIDYDDLTHLKGAYWNDRTYMGPLNLTRKSR